MSVCLGAGVCLNTVRLPEHCEGTAQSLVFKLSGVVEYSGDGCYLLCLCIVRIACLHHHETKWKSQLCLWRAGL